MKAKLIKQLTKLTSIDFHEPLSEDDDDLLCQLEQCMGGSLVDAVIDGEFTPEETANIIVDGNDEWEPLELEEQNEIFEILKNVNDE